MARGTFVGWRLLATGKAGRHPKLASSIILSISLAGDGLATTQRPSAISRRRFPEIPLDVRPRTRLRYVVPSSNAPRVTTDGQAPVGGMSCRSTSWMDIFPTSQNDRESVPPSLPPPSPINTRTPEDSCSTITPGILARCRIHTGGPISSQHVFRCLP